MQDKVCELTNIDGVITMNVVSQPHVTPHDAAEQSLRVFNEICDAIEGDANSTVVGVVVNAIEAPPAFGPRTEEGFGRVLRVAQAHQLRLAIAVRRSPTQRLQFSRLSSKYAPTFSELFTTVANANEWVRKTRRHSGVLDVIEADQSVG